MLTSFLRVLFLMVSVLVVATILIQAGQESGFAGAFGAGGGSQTVFGARAGTFMTRATAGLAAAFMLLAFLLVLLGSRGAPPPPEAVIPDALPASASTEIPAGSVAQPITATVTPGTAVPSPQPSGAQ